MYWTPIDEATTIKIILVGNSASGKTSLLLQYNDETVPETLCSTISVDFNVKTIEIDKKQYKLQIWDTTGQERFSSITDNFYRSLDGVILTFDVHTRASFEGLSKWLNKTREHAPNVPILLVGCQSDKPDTLDSITDFEANQFAQQNKLLGYVETSAKNNINVDDAFMQLTKAAIEFHSKSQKNQDELLDLPASRRYAEEDKEERSCCLIM